MNHRLTPAQRATLIEAAAAPREITLGYNNGAATAARERKMERLCAAGLLRPYPHGGWIITDAGRAAAAKVQRDTRSNA